MKFLHAADIHLDSPLTGQRARDDLPEGRIASREMFLGVGSLPHLNCSRRSWCGGGRNEADEYGNAQ